MSIQWPFGAADSQSPTFAATLTATISNRKTILDLGTMSAACALTITPVSDLAVGAELHIKAKSDGTARDITLTGALPATMSGTISKTKMQTFVYDGTSFKAVGAIVQLD